jgi:hypothetical protein
MYANSTEHYERPPNPENAAKMAANTDDQRHDITASNPITLFHPGRRRFQTLPFFFPSAH